MAQVCTLVCNEYKKSTSNISRNPYMRMQSDMKVQKVKQSFRTEAWSKVSQDCGEYGKLLHNSQNFLMRKRSSNAAIKWNVQCQSFHNLSSKPPCSNVCRLQPSTKYMVESCLWFCQCCPGIFEGPLSFVDCPLCWIGRSTEICSSTCNISGHRITILCTGVSMLVR